MSRDDGFAVADTDSGMFADPKILALARRLHDSIRTGAAIALYDAVRLASWKAGCRLTLDETVPGWWLDSYDDLAAELVAVGLLDAERRVPEHAWEGWFGPARDRRERFRILGSKGGKASHQPLDRMLDPTLDRTPEPVRPSVRPSDSPKSPRTRGHRNGSARANGTSPRLLREGSPEVDRRALVRIGDVLHAPEAAPAEPIDPNASDPERWLANRA